MTDFLRRWGYIYLSSIMTSGGKLMLVSLLFLGLGIILALTHSNLAWVL